MVQKGTTFTTIFRVKKCYFHYDFSCKKVPVSLRYAKNDIKTRNYCKFVKNQNANFALKLGKGVGFCRGL
jgi:hypothetical protein